MKTLASIIGIIAPATVCAAEHATEAESGIFVWIFAGMCALVLVAQVVPAFMLLTGMIKGLAGRKEEDATTEK